MDIDDSVFEVAVCVPAEHRRGGDSLVILLTRSQKRPNTSTMSLVKTLDHSVGWPFVPSIFLVLFLTSNDLLEIGRGHVMVQTSTGIL